MRGARLCVGHAISVEREHNLSFASGMDVRDDRQADTLALLFTATLDEGHWGRPHWRGNGLRPRRNSLDWRERCHSDFTEDTAAHKNTFALAQPISGSYTDRTCHANTWLTATNGAERRAFEESVCSSACPRLGAWRTEHILKGLVDLCTGQRCGS